MFDEIKVKQKELQISDNHLYKLMEVARSMVTGSTNQQVAEEFGVSKETVKTWRKLIKDTGIMDKFQDERDQFTKAVLVKLRTVATNAVDIMHERLVQIQNKIASGEEVDYDQLKDALTCLDKAVSITDKFTDRGASKEKDEGNKTFIFGTDALEKAINNSKRIYDVDATVR